MCVPASTRLPCQPCRCAQRGEQAQRKDPVLVAEVGAQAQQEAVVTCGRSPLAADPRPGSGAAARRRAVVEPRRDHADTRALDQRVGDELLARVLGEHHDALGRRQAVAAGGAIVLPAVGVGEVAGVAIGDQVELADHEALAERQRELYVAWREGLLRAMKHGRLCATSGVELLGGEQLCLGQRLSSSRVWRSICSARTSTRRRSASVRASARISSRMCTCVPVIAPSSARASSVTDRRGAGGPRRCSACSSTSESPSGVCAR